MFGNLCLRRMIDQKMKEHQAPKCLHREKAVINEELPHQVGRIINFCCINSMEFVITDSITLNDEYMGILSRGHR